MESKIAKILKLPLSAVAVLFTNEKPQGVLEFKNTGHGCVVSLFGAAARGRTAAVSRDTVRCSGAFVGLGFGCAWDKIPGGIEYFLSTGRGEGYPEGEGYKKSPEIARESISKFPITDIPYDYVVFKPLSDVDVLQEQPVLVSFLASPDQLSALVILANYRRTSNDNVIVPFAAGCSQVCLIPYQESLRDEPRAVIGLTDVTVRPLVDPEVLSFTVPYAMFLEMEEDAPGSFLGKHFWTKLAERIPEPRL
ncbi:MAG: DUF169 domain-containing protein [Armatimonadota bacterium]|nr:DUF169 domain-containing protein [Armatimonadota bacterium]